jgi:NADH-quinone oxidoreductase subunit G
MCFKCVRIVRDLAGEPELGVFQRGSYAHIGILDDLKLANEFSGNTVEYCPVGALTSKSFRYQIRDWLLKKTPSVCNLCSDGCNLNIEKSNGRVYRHMARRNTEVDDGWLCDRGRYGFDIANFEERLSRTQIRRGNSLEACSREETLALINKHLSKLIDENKGSEIAAVGSPILSNEEAYAIRKFFGDVVKTENIDFQTDTSKPLEPKLLEYVGLEGTINELQNDDLFLFVGADISVEHPIASLKIKKAVSKANAKAVFIGSYDKRLGNFPVTNIRTEFGAEPAVVNDIISLINGMNVDSKKVIQLKALVENIKSSKNIHIITGREFFNHPQRDALLSSLIKLKKTSNAKLSILPVMANYMGVSRFGLSGGNGHMFSDILEKINTGLIKTMFIFGADPVSEYPDKKYVQETLKKLDFLVVVSPYINQTANYASILLPQALPGEYGGSFVNIEGRIQRFEYSGDKNGYSITPVWRILDDLGDLLDMGITWYNDSIIRDDISKTMNGYEKINNIPEVGLMGAVNRINNYEHGDYSPSDAPSAGSEYPYLLMVAPSVHHPFWLTEKSENLMRIAGNQYVLMHPDDAEKEKITAGQTVRIGNEDTAVNLQAEISDKVNSGEILIINSFAENSVNRLMSKDIKYRFVSVKKN